MNNECHLKIFEPNKEPRTVTLNLDSNSQLTEIFDEHGPTLEYLVIHKENGSEPEEIKAFIESFDKSKKLEKRERKRAARKRKKERQKAPPVDLVSDLKTVKKIEDEREILEAMKMKNCNLKKTFNIKCNKSIDLNTNFNPSVNRKILIDSTPKAVELVVLDDSDDDDTNIQLNIDRDYNMVSYKGNVNANQYNADFVSKISDRDNVVVVDDSDSDVECISVHDEIETLSDENSEDDLPPKKVRFDEFVEVNEPCDDVETVNDSTEESNKCNVSLVEEFVLDSLNAKESKPKKAQTECEKFDYMPFGMNDSYIMNYNFDSERNNFYINSFETKINQKSEPMAEDESESDLNTLETEIVIPIKRDPVKHEDSNVSPTKFTIPKSWMKVDRISRRKKKEMARDYFFRKNNQYFCKTDNSQLNKGFQQFQHNTVFEGISKNQKFYDSKEVIQEKIKTDNHQYYNAQNEEEDQSFQYSNFHKYSKFKSNRKKATQNGPNFKLNFHQNLRYGYQNQQNQSGSQQTNYLPSQNQKFLQPQQNRQFQSNFRNQSQQQNHRNQSSRNFMNQSQPNSILQTQQKAELLDQSSMNLRFPRTRESQFHESSKRYYQNKIQFQRPNKNQQFRPNYNPTHHQLPFNRIQKLTSSNNNLFSRRPCKPKHETNRNFDENFNEQNQYDLRSYESKVLNNFHKSDDFSNKEQFCWDSNTNFDFVPVSANDPINPPWSNSSKLEYKSISRRSWINENMSQN